jgi:transposase-like protein
VIKMVMIPLVCPHCGSANVVNNGHYANGKQRYKCNNPKCPCAAFADSYSYNACDPAVKKKIYEMTVNGSGTRAIARVLKISKNTVTAVLKKLKVKYPV